MTNNYYDLLENAHHHPVCSMQYLNITLLPVVVATFCHCI